MLYSNVLQIKFIWMNEKISVELMQVGLVSAHLSCVTYGAGENKYWAVGNFSQWILLLILCISQAQIHIQILSGILLFFRCIFLSKIHFPKTYSFQGLYPYQSHSNPPPTLMNFNLNLFFFVWLNHPRSQMKTGPQTLSWLYPCLPIFQVQKFLYVQMKCIYSMYCRH